MARRLTEQAAEYRPRAQAFPVAVWERAQLGVTFQDQGGPVRRAETAKPKALLASAIDQTGIVFGRDFDGDLGRARLGLDHGWSSASIQANV